MHRRRQSPGRTGLWRLFWEAAMAGAWKRWRNMMSGRMIRNTGRFSPAWPSRCGSSVGRSWRSWESCAAPGGRRRRRWGAWPSPMPCGAMKSRGGRPVSILRYGGGGTCGKAPPPFHLRIYDTLYAVSGFLKRFAFLHAFKHRFLHHFCRSHFVAETEHRIGNKQRDNAAWINVSLLAKCSEKYDF